MKNFTKPVSPYLTMAMIILLLLSAFNVEATEYHYFWGHPKPMGNTIYGMAFKDNSTGWAVTGCGNILKTVDSGSSWDLTWQNTNGCVDLYDILITDAETIIVSGDDIILRSTDNGETWESMAIPEDAYFLYDLTLIPGGGISAAGWDGLMLVSFDDGISWTNTGPGIEGITLRHLWKSSTEAFVLIGDSIYRTLDGGENWTSMDYSSEFPEINFNDIFFVNNDTGYVTASLMLLKTENGGESWFEVEQSENKILYHFRTIVINENHWLATSAGEGGEVWETTDAGITWENLFILTDENVGAELLSMTLLPGSNRMLFGASYGFIYSTDDWGETFDLRTEFNTNNPSSPVVAIYRKPDGTIFSSDGPLVGDLISTFLQSNDGGLSWNETTDGPGLLNISDLSFFDNQFGVAGYKNNIRYTLDGGNTWNNSTLPEEFRIANFALPRENLYYVATFTLQGEGKLFKSINQGVSWEPVSDEFPDLLSLQVSFINETTGFAFETIPGEFKVYKTEDAGDVWFPVSFNGVSGLIKDISWQNETRGVLTSIGETGGIFLTEDSGQNWSKVDSIQAIKLTKFEGNRIAALDHSFLYVSEDGGLTWEKVLVPFSYGSMLSFTSVETIKTVEITPSGFIVGARSGSLMVLEENTVTGIDEGAGKSRLYGGIEILSVYPIPAKEEINVEYRTSDRNLTITLLDLKGRIITSYAINNPGNIDEVQTLKLNDTGNLSSGVYFLRLHSSRSFSTQKIVISNE